MERANRKIKPILIGGVMFLSLGITIANATLSQLGLNDNYVWLFGLAFVFAAVLLRRSIFILALLVLGVAAASLPEASLASYYLDRDVLLALMCSTVLVPSVYEVLMH